jgi:flagellar protein FlaI
VYGTFHANTASETVLRLSSPPIEVPKISLNALGLIIIQHRDRRSGRRMTLQIAELDRNGDENVILQYNPKKDKLELKSKPHTLLKRLEEFQGIEEDQFYRDIQERALLLRYLAYRRINDIAQVGEYINRFYSERENLLKSIKQKLNTIETQKKQTENPS